MTSSNYAISYQARFVAGASGLLVGDVVFYDAANDGFDLATPASLAAGARAAGVVAQLGQGGFVLHSAGPIAPNITGLGPGTASPVRVSALGRLERVASPTESDDYAGMCDASGLLHAAFGSPYPMGGGAITALGGDLYGEPDEQYVRGTTGNLDGDLETKHQTYGQSVDGRLGKVATLVGLSPGEFFESIQEGWPNNTRAIIDVRAHIVAAAGSLRLQRTYAVDMAGTTTVTALGTLQSEPHGLTPGDFDLVVAGGFDGITVRVFNESAATVNVSLSWDGDRMLIP